GLRTGFAVIADGNVVFTTTLSSPIDVVDTSVLIGARIGQSPFNTDLKIESKPGYVRALQHLFECISVNKNDLSIEDARMILTGEITLEELLNREP
ncbi:MAG: hypothetical protein ACTSU3_03330, partial [Candidatus Thorarchaeota archaeon]